MTFYVTNQNTVVLCMVLLGVFLGLVYDAFAVKRILVRTPKILMFFEDLLFCFISVIIFVFAIYITNYGYVRWYEAGAVLFGYALYRLTFSKLIKKIVISLVKTVVSIIMYISGIVIYPVKLIFKKVLMLLKTLASILGKVLQKTLQKSYSRGKIRAHTKLSHKGFYA